MSDTTIDGHNRAAQTALDAAKLLLDAENPWCAVGLHYAALHLIHADLANRAGVDDSMRSPEIHNSRWENGVRIRWGINDVVRQVYPSAVSEPFTSLCAASRAIRYTAPVPLGQRQWQEFERLREALNKS